MFVNEPWITKRLEISIGLNGRIVHKQKTVIGTVAKCLLITVQHVQITSVVLWIEVKDQYDVREIAIEKPTFLRVFVKELPQGIDQVNVAYIPIAPQVLKQLVYDRLERDDTVVVCNAKPREQAPHKKRLTPLALDHQQD